MLSSNTYSRNCIKVVAGFECPGGRLTPQQRKDIVRQNNKFRSLLIHGKLKNRNGTYMPRGKNMLLLKWSCQLENSAQRWANQCVFGHSPRNQRQGIGENVYAYWSSESVEKLRNTAGTEAGKSWWSELPKLYKQNPSNNLTDDVARQGVLHFTQMAWGKTHKIGCGIATNCDGGRTLIAICHYSPAGNMLKELIYELGEPCKTDSDCNTKKCAKKSGLCRK
ncbi:venom allergen antigen-like protein 1, putative [Brugia malayi]|uniref:Bm4233, isoform a n=2 Tax=Brugia malayi TaxID=6279 RepID=A0A0J9Y762_BRUMA|nr:venom allergen antigen-like protein 1, putative [Brugia malayi]CDQ03741.1 Bm4233, isoform a [Brugia malayi]VIO90427.1 venom allergen antigen-like protein 1, putative [Brugia malayi]